MRRNSFSDCAITTTTPALTWLHQRLDAQNMTPEDSVRLVGSGRSGGVD
jgi:hypothetical protein